MYSAKVAHAAFRTNHTCHVLIQLIHCCIQQKQVVLYYFHVKPKHYTEKNIYIFMNRDSVGAQVMQCFIDAQ